MCLTQPSGTETLLMIKSYKAIKMAHREKLILGYFEKLEDIEAAKKLTFQHNGSDYKWSRYSHLRTCQLNKKKDTSSNRVSQNRRAAGGPHESNVKQKTHTKNFNKGGLTSKQNVIADTLKLLLSL
jgi:hypothetical protein